MAILAIGYLWRAVIPKPDHRAYNLVETTMLIQKKLPRGYIYPQLTQAPMSTYAEFLNFFREGQTIDDNTNLTTDYTIPNAMFRVSIASGYLTKTKNMAIPDEFLADVVLTAAGAELIQTAMDLRWRATTDFSEISNVQAWRRHLCCV